MQIARQIEILHSLFGDFGKRRGSDGTRRGGGNSFGGITVGSGRRTCLGRGSARSRGGRGKFVFLGSVEFLEDVAEHVVDAGEGIFRQQDGSAEASGHLQGEQIQIILISYIIQIKNRIRIQMRNRAKLQDKRICDRNDAWFDIIAAYLRDPEKVSSRIDAGIEVEDFALVDAEWFGLREVLASSGADVTFVAATHRSVVRWPILGQELGQVVAKLDHSLSGDHDLEWNIENG